MLTTSWDDGGYSDVRIADLLGKYEIPGVFYWPVEWHSLAYANGYEPLYLSNALVIAADFEIGSHTITHRHLTKMSKSDAFYEIVGSRTILEDLFSTEVKKFCPPRGYTNEELTKITLDYYDSQRLTKGDNLVHVHPNSGANGNRNWVELAKEKMDQGDVELWGHSWEVDKFNLWDELEAFFESISR